jgi:hypothetical protein
VELVAPQAAQVEMVQRQFRLLAGHYTHMVLRVAEEAGEQVEEQDITIMTIIQQADFCLLAVGREVKQYH